MEPLTTTLPAAAYVEANWKVLTENYHECSHCPLIHPELCEVSPPTSGENFDLPGEWVGGAMDLREHAETMSFDGRSAGRRIEVECAWYFPAADVDPTYAVEFWDRTNRQDWAACESVQRGLASPPYRPGPLAPNEDAVARFVSMLARTYRDGCAPV